MQPLGAGFIGAIGCLSNQTRTSALEKRWRWPRGCSDLMSWRLRLADVHLVPGALDGGHGSGQAT